MHSDRFRAGVGAVIVNESGLLLAFRRKNDSEKWQLPQGGLNKDESTRAGVYREILEETGLEAPRVTLVAEYPVWLGYEFDQTVKARMHVRGQVQKWFLFQLRGDYSDELLHSAVDEEFDAWQWMTVDQLLARTISFKREVYISLAAEFFRIFDPGSTVIPKPEIVNERKRNAYSDYRGNGRHRQKAGVPGVGTRLSRNSACPFTRKAEHPA